MMKYTLVAMLLIVVGTSFGAHNLLVNGTQDAVLYYGDTVIVSLSTESPGAEVKFSLYADINDNGAPDYGEPCFFAIRTLDGSPFDEDETTNGYIETELSSTPENGYISGNFVLKAEDNGVSDYASIHFMPITSSLSISGLVSNPMQGGISIFVARDTSDTGIVLSDFFGTYTSSDGNFFIGVPDEFYGDTFYFFPTDIAGLLLDYVSPELPADTFVMTGPISGVVVSFTSTDGTQISGNLIDNYGNQLPDTVRISFIGAAFTLFDTSVYAATKWSNIGSYSRELKSEWGSIWMVMEDIFPLYPHYLAPPEGEVFIVGSGSATYDIVSYLADTTVSGHVYLNGEPADEVIVKTKGYKDGDEIGSTFTLSYSDGHYLLQVSQDVDSYHVYLDESSLPPFSEVEEGTLTVYPGATGVDFHVTAPIPGDANGDGVVNTNDLLYLANYLFSGGPPPDPMWEGDENCDGSVNTNDLLYLANYLFSGGPAPVPCYPEGISSVNSSPMSFFRLIASKTAFALKSLLK